MNPILIQILAETALGVAKKVFPAVAGKLGVDDIPTSAISSAVKADPSLVNALNQEHPVQSGVTWGGGAGFLFGVAICWHEIGSGSPNPDTLGMGLGVVIAGLFTLYRRWTNRPPLFSKWFKKGT
ncbi:MAG: hypothetical protein J0H94_21220 [Rhizobiales bacterium]|nr:hypothetical protein [Hyphomicrobiales bacterium]